MEAAAGCGLCGVLPLRELDEVFASCSRCLSVKYCGKACQKKDWDRGHKDKCSRKFGAPKPAPPKKPEEMSDKERLRMIYNLSLRWAEAKRTSALATGIIEMQNETIRTKPCRCFNERMMAYWERAQKRLCLFEGCPVRVTEECPLHQVRMFTRCKYHRSRHLKDRGGAPCNDTNRFPESHCLVLTFCSTECAAAEMRRAHEDDKARLFSMEDDGTIVTWRKNGEMVDRERPMYLT